MKAAGMLSPNTDVADLAKRAFVRLDGVTDGWIEKLTVERLAEGRIPPDQAQRLALELATIGAPFLVATCCAPKSKIAR
jgi:hypothetical protein